MTKPTQLAFECDFVLNIMSVGKLYIVSTPIGNLEDITLRAIKVLKEVDFIAAEDTRHSCKILNHYDIHKPLISYWSEREKLKTNEVIQKLQIGKTIALISDSGTPGISDPGNVLINKVIELGITIIPIPGASAFVSAIVTSGLSTKEFVFIGFLPPKPHQRQKKLSELRLETKTLIFYEAPHRIIESLTDIKDIFSERKIALAKELTKLYEQILRGTASDIIFLLKNTVIAGEYVITVEGLKPQEHSIEDLLEEVRSLMKKGISRKESVRSIANIYGVSKNNLYTRSLE